MKLSELLINTTHEKIQGGDPEVKGICYDSRKTEPGFLFVCVKGFETDGHKYAESAVKLGAVALLCEDAVNVPENVTVIKAENTRVALGEVSSVFYDEPSSNLKVIGVTGTNGKTTTTYLLGSIFREYGYKVGIIGTIENRIGDKVIPTDKTTPESLELNMLFSKMHESGVKTVAMEVSSHSLDLHRVDFCKFDVGIFTNLTQDHLDYHKTMENYRNAKSRLFSMCKYGVVNGDDPASAYFIENGECEFLTFGLDKSNDLYAWDISVKPDGVSFTANIYGVATEISLPIPGKFTVYNALGAIGAAVCLSVPAEIIKSGLEKNTGVTGRAQTIKTGKGKNIIVDYSHTPDSLKNILEAISEFADKRVITVFGCGGDRDKGKRPMMGEIAGNMSDVAIITSDNPRSEEPLSIILEIEEGVKRTGCKYIKMPDRREAINYAVKIAEPGDVILIAGKGHENYQIFSDHTIHFDDADVAAEAVKLLEDI